MTEAERPQASGIRPQGQSPEGQPEAKSERHLASHVFNMLVMVAGGSALAWMLHQLGWLNARTVLHDVGGWFAVLLALDIAALACDAAAIHAFMRPESRMVSYWRVLAAQASGRAVNIVTPGGALGEATKVTMLVGHAPRARVVSSIVLFNLATVYLSVAIVVLGVPLTMAMVDLPHQLAVVVWIALAVVLATMIALGVVIHRGALATLLEGARELRFISRERIEAWRQKLAEIDDHLRELHTDRSSGTRLGFVLIGASRVLAWASTLVVLHVVGVAITPILVVGVLSVGVLIGWVSNIVPLGLGVADGSNYALFDVLGASGAHGVIMTMLNRVRSLTIALLGLLVMAIGHTATRLAIARRARNVQAMLAARRAK